MAPRKSSGFEEKPHTADCALFVWAPDFVKLLQEAAKGMNALIGGQLQAGICISRHLLLSEFDRETLLVSFLSELLFLNENERLIFDNIYPSFDGSKLEVEMDGSFIEGQLRFIKAVTFNNMRIHQSTRGLETTIVFDI